MVPRNISITTWPTVPFPAIFVFSMIGLRLIFSWISWSLLISPITFFLGVWLSVAGPWPFISTWAIILMLCYIILLFQPFLNNSSFVIFCIQSSSFTRPFSPSFIALCSGILKIITTFMTLMRGWSWYIIRLTSSSIHYWTVKLVLHPPWTSIFVSTPSRISSSLN